MTRNASLVRLLTRTIENDCYPLSPRIRSLKAMLAKLEPPLIVAVEPYPAPKRNDRPGAAVSRENGGTVGEIVSCS
jgi:hypothetical protein